MDRAYEGQETRHLAVALGFTPVVPPRQNRFAPWAYDRQLYKRRNEVERLFRRLKGFRRIFTLRSLMCSFSGSSCSRSSSRHCVSVNRP